MNVADAYMAYQLVKRLMTPFTSWDAFAAGVIDKDGKVLKKYSAMTSEEKNSFSPFDAAILKIKKLISLAPGGSSVLGGLAASAILLRREEFTDHNVDTMLAEDAPTNSAGSGQVAGIGQPPQGEPAARGPRSIFKRYNQSKKKLKRP
jgi:hypothetical protein